MSRSIFALIATGLFTTLTVIHAASDAEKDALRELHVSEVFGTVKAVSYNGQGEWLVAGSAGIMTRAKGSETWTRAKEDVGRGWNAAASDGQGNWMAVGSNGIARRAKGSATWVRAKGEVDGRWNAVASDGQGGWVAVGNNGIVSRAKGSDTWERAQEAGPGWNAVTSDGQGAWVAVGIFGISSRMKGSDTWERAEDVGTGWNAVASDGQGSWVAVGAFGIASRAAGSDTWERAKGGVGRRWNAVASDGQGGWVAVGAFGIASRAAGSDTWERAKGDVDNRRWSAVASDGQGGLVAVGSDGTASRAAGSDTWERAKGEIGGGWNAVVSDGQGGWVAVGNNKIMSRTTESDTWEHTDEIGGRWNAAATDGQGDWVAVGSSGIVNRAKRSGTWERVENVGGGWNAVASDGQGGWVAVGDNGIVNRAKGSNIWERAREDVGDGWNAVASDGQGSWVAVGNNGIVNRAKGSDTWERAKNVGGDWNAVASDGQGGWVAVGKNGIMNRAKGSDTWKRAKEKAFYGGKSVMHDGDKGWVVTSSDSFGLSEDGLYWSEVLPFEDFPADVRSFNLGEKMSLLRMPSGKWKPVQRAQEWHVDDEGALLKVEAGGTLPTLRKLDVEGESALLDAQRNGASCPENRVQAYVWAQDDHAWQTTPLKRVGKSTHALDEFNKPLPVSLTLEGQEGVDASPGRALRFVAGLLCGTAITTFPGFPQPKEYVYKPWWQEIPLTAAAPLAAVLLLALLAMLATLVHLANPLALFKVYHAIANINLGHFGELTIPIFGWKITDILKLLNSLVEPFLRNQRTQRAWVGKHVDRWREVFKNEDTVQRSREYVPLPCLLKDPDPAPCQPLPSPSRELILWPIDRSSRHVIEVVGIGGAGKTMLIVQLSRWLLDGDNAEAGCKVALPVLVEKDTTDLCATVKQKLDAKLDQVTDDFFVRLLLKSGYLVPVLDRLSERDSHTIDHVLHAPGLVQIRLMLVSTRREFVYEGARKRTISPQPLGTASLM